MEYSNLQFEFPSWFVCKPLSCFCPNQQVRWNANCIWHQCPVIWRNYYSLIPEYAPTAWHGSITIISNCSPFLTQKYRNTHFSVLQQLDNATLQKDPSPSSILYEVNTCRAQRFHHLLGINCSHHHNHNHSNKKVLVLLPNYRGIWFTVIERGGGRLYAVSFDWWSTNTHTPVWLTPEKGPGSRSQWYADIPRGAQWLTLWHVQ